jgi:hypothetical protein
MKNDKKRPTVKIQDNWSKIEEFERMVREQTGDPNARFNAHLFFIKGTGRHLFIPCKYRKTKKNGEFTDKYFDIDVFVEFCPFTGKPLYQENSLEESKETEKARMIEFACNVFDINYGTDTSFRDRATQLYNETYGGNEQ